jgi:cytoplasmic iron level regulating protein YaaA (DUF328/UPF0246 family)
VKVAILLPPSKGQASGGTGPPWKVGDRVLDRARSRVMRSLATEMRRSNLSTLGRLLDAQGDTLRAARDANRSVGTTATMPAVERYDGVLYGELGYAALPKAARARVARSLVIFNALHGVVGAEDPLPAHRLSFDARLGTLGRLSTWWQPRITDELATRLGGAVVWDLLPNEHAAAWDPSRVPMRRHLRVRFLDANGRPVSHWNKLLKGALAAHLARRGGSSPEVLASFEHPTGYRWDPSATEEVGAVTHLVVRAPTT